MNQESLTGALERWDGIGVVVRHDAETGAWIFIALHDDTLGPPTGGSRMRVYPSPAQALVDAKRLAAGMTAKWAAIDLAFGGGKAVLAVPRPLAGEERRGLLRRYGRLVAALHGGFSTGPDLGTTPEDMLVIAAEAPGQVHGVDLATGRVEDPGPYTARGVYEAIRAALGHRFGSDDPAGRRVVIEGVGNVGAPLARRLAASGADLLLADLDSGAAERLAAETGCQIVAPEAVPGTACDVYSPCAVGATLNARSIPLLGCAIVAGSANNQLEDEEDALRLRARGILYAPDYVANGGGALAFGLLGRGVPAAEIEARLTGIGDTLREIFTEAEQRGETPLRAAARRVERVLARARAEREAPVMA